MDLETKMRRELLRYIISKQIFCPLTGQVLDLDECVVILDSDNDPVAAFSQEGWQKALDVAAQDPSVRILREGLHVDESTVHPSE